MTAALFSRIRVFLGLVLAGVLLVGTAEAQDLLRADAPNDWLIENATILTVANGTIEEGDILVEDGVIAEVGDDLSAPGGVETYDASGKHVIPGLVEAHQHFAIGSTNEATNPVTAEVSPGDVLNPFDISIYRGLAGGLTTAHLMHGSANPIGGENETVKLRYGHIDPDDLRMEGAPRTIKFALGENPTGLYGESRDIQPRTRMGVEQVIREALTEAERYDEQMQAYEAGERDHPPEYSERMEVLADILNGNIIVHAHSYRADEILMLMDVMEDFGVEDLVFQHVNEGFKVAPELADFGAGASIFTDRWSYKFEVYYSTAYNASILAENGVRTSINTDIPGDQRDLFHQAAKAQRYGDLSDNETLALITLNPAHQLGIEDRVGSIEEGKDADLVVFDDHPLSIYAEPQRTYVDGVVRFDHEDDPDDMRLRVDPEGTPVPTMNDHGHSHGAHGHPHGAHAHPEDGNEETYLEATDEGVFLRHDTE